MPRNSSGVYTQPANTAAVSGATIDPSAFNTLVADIASELTGSLPVNGSAGMTSPIKLPNGSVSAPSAQFTASTNTGMYKTTDGIGFTIGGTLYAELTTSGWKNGSGTLYQVTPTIAWTDVASASTTDIGAVDSLNLRVTGTTTITAFGTVASGTQRTLRFAGALTLTHNATSLILPGAANITTAANDRCVAVSLGSGNWIVTNYEKASGGPTVQITNIATGSGLTGGPITDGTGTVAINTNNAVGIGAYGIMINQTGGSIAAGDTTAGSNLKITYWSSGVIQTSVNSPNGTWRNVSGVTLGNGEAGLWIRTA